MSDTYVPPVALPTSRQVAIGALVAAVVGSIAAVFFILPAELGIDPTGFGEKTGLTGLAGDAAGMNIYLQRGMKRKNVLFSLPASAKPDEATLRSALAGKGVAMPAEVKSDHWSYELQPYESIEMKYRMAQGAPMVFAWKASAPIHYDEHSVPDQGGNPATESFVITDGAAQTALYVAPFTGIHGWFWQNQSLQPVSLTIDSTGGFTGSVIFNQGGEFPRELAKP
jgi:hypothetical protein